MIDTFPWSSPQIWCSALFYSLFISTWQRKLKLKRWERKRGKIEKRQRKSVRTWKCWQILYRGEIVTISSSVKPFHQDPGELSVIHLFCPLSTCSLLSHLTLTQGWGHRLQPGMLFFFSQPLELALIELAFEWEAILKKKYMYLFCNSMRWTRTVYRGSVSLITRVDYDQLGTQAPATHALLRQVMSAEDEEDLL